VDVSHDPTNSGAFHQRSGRSQGNAVRGLRAVSRKAEQRGQANIWSLRLSGKVRLGTSSGSELVQTQRDKGKVFLDLRLN